MLRRTFKAFQYRDYRLLWIGACTSSIGTWMQKLAQSWLVLDLSGSPFLLGLDAFLGEIPIFLFSLVGGVVADRRDRRHLLIASQVLQLSCALVLTVLAAGGWVRVWHILTLSFFVGLAQAFGGPAYHALIPTLVKSEDLPNAIALNSIQFNLARVIGPVLGGIALTQLGAAWCFGLNSVSYIPVILALAVVTCSFKPAASVETMMESMRQGIRFIRGREAMVSLIVLAFAMTALAIPMIVFLPVVARDVFHRGAQTYTVLMVVSGAGSVCGALVTAALGNMERKGRKSLVLLVALGVLMAAFAYSTILPLSCVILFVWSGALMGVLAMASSLVQLITSDEMRGRVMSVYNVAFRGGMPFGSLVTGALAPAISVPSVLSVNGVLLAALGGYFLFSRRKIATL
jgi:predicted MFS family arabinose efflux permease